MLSTKKFASYFFASFLINFTAIGQTPIGYETIIVTPPRVETIVLSDGRTVDKVVPPVTKRVPIYAPNSPQVQSSQTAQSEFPKIQSSVPNVPNFAVKNYWVIVRETLVYDLDNNPVDYLSYGSMVKVYEEMNGMGKIDQMNEKWVKMSNLTSSKVTKKPAKLNEEHVNVKGSGVEMASAENAQEVENVSYDLPTRDEEYYVRYVSANVLNERDAPNGNTVNKQYKRQLLRVYGTQGKWLRVSPSFASPRWVHGDYVSETQPPKPKPVKLSYQFDDPRIEESAIPEVEMYNLSKYDVETIWLAAKVALNTGKCSKIYDADKSIKKTDTYYLNCGGSSNKFFKRNGNQITFLN